MPKLGRPTLDTPKMRKEICQRIAEGESLRTICASEGMPDLSTVADWLKDETKADFTKQYVCAREAQADFYADEIIEIADDGRRDYAIEDGIEVVDHDHISRSRLRIDARKWYASKLHSKKYGDKVAVGGADDLPPIAITAIERLIIKPKAD